jgi:hypothetical protein
MPFTSLVEWYGTGGFVVAWAVLAMAAAWCGAHFGGTRRHAWAAGLLVIFSGFFAPFWLKPDTFALYGATGALALLLMGLGRARRTWQSFAFSGAMCGLAHLTRADGLLLPMVLVLVALWPQTMPGEGGLKLRPVPAGGNGSSSVPPALAAEAAKQRLSWRTRLIHAGAGLLAYALVMSPWLLRNLGVGAPLLPAGGTATIWLRGYDEIANYPAGTLTLQHFLDWGLGNIVQSRLDALVTNLQHFVAEQGLVVLAPFILIGMWRRRRDPILSGVWVYALGLHLAMTLVFAYPGMRGGLFHSSTALLPFWFSVGVLGIDDAVDWIAARRRHWKARQAKMIFTAALVVLAAVLTLSILAARLPADAQTRDEYRARYLDILGMAVITSDDEAVDDLLLMVNDPAALYYYTGVPGVVVPNGGVETVRAVAAQYGVTHVVLDVNRTPPLTGLFLGRESADFLTEVALLNGDDTDPANDVRIFKVDLP